MKKNLFKIIDDVSTESISRKFVEEVITVTEEARKAHSKKEPSYGSERYESWINKDELMIRILGNFDRLLESVVIMLKDKASCMKTIQKINSRKYSKYFYDTQTLDINELKKLKVELLKDIEYSKQMRLFERVKLIGLAIEKVKSLISSYRSYLEPTIKECFSIIKEAEESFSLKIDSNNVKLIDKTQTREVDFTKGSLQHKPIYIIFGGNSCVLSNHGTEDVRAIVEDINTGKPVTMNVLYCSKCDKYSINYLSYESYLNKNIIPKAIFKTEGMPSCCDLNKFSILTLYGYNAKKDNPSETVRRKILSHILDNKIASKGQILEILRFNIEFIGKKQGLENAVAIWVDDMKFVNDYNLNKQREVAGKIINLDKYKKYAEQKRL